MPQTCFICQVSGHNRVTCAALQDAEKDIQLQDAALQLQAARLKAAQEKKAGYERQWQKVKEKREKHRPTTEQKEVKPEQQPDDESDEGGEAGQQHDMKPHVTPNGVSIVVVNRVSINQTR